MLNNSSTFTPLMACQMMRENMSFEPTASQNEAIEMLARLLFSTENQPTAVINGFAGTGKTTLMKAFCDVASDFKYNLVLMAPTGRAAKVLSNITGRPAHTIHKTIYRQETAGEFNSAFELNFNKNRGTIFIVDEASMISDFEAGDFGFGSGNLLVDLVSFVFSREGCRLLIVGDPAQLPPVGGNEAPALDGDMLESLGLDVESVWLTDVVRQAESSAILENASCIREIIGNDPEFVGFPHLVADYMSDVERVSGEELIECLTKAIDNYGQDSVLVVTRSNQRAKQFNLGIRNMVLYAEEELQRGDMLIVSKNNYCWLGDKTKDFIANGDIAEVKRIGRQHEMYGMRFADVTLRLREHDDIEIDATIMLDFLTADAANLTHQQEETLYNMIAAEYADLGSQRKLFEAMKKDKWYNALRVKYAYAVTCHKAQGGQWDVVFIDLGYITEDMMTTEFLKWLYTAITRATTKVYLVNFSDRFFE